MKPCSSVIRPTHTHTHIHYTRQHISREYSKRKKRQPEINVFQTMGRFLPGANIFKRIVNIKKRKQQLLIVRRRRPEFFSLSFDCFVHARAGSPDLHHLPDFESSENKK